MSVLNFIIISIIFLGYIFAKGYRIGPFGQNEKVQFKSLISSLLGMCQKGYMVDYRLEEGGLKTNSSNRIYSPSQVQLVDLQYFEKTKDHGDGSILYAIETFDGGKGTLVDFYDPDSDLKVKDFMKKVKIVSTLTNDKLKLIYSI